MDTAFSTRTSIPRYLDTSHIYAAIAALLKATGKPMQSNDIWIAALAQQHGLTVLTKDTDFQRITGL